MSDPQSSNTEHNIESLYWNIHNGLAGKCDTLYSKSSRSESYRSGFVMRLKDGQNHWDDPVRTWAQYVTHPFHQSEIQEFVSTDSDLTRVIMYNSIILGSKVKIVHDHRYLKITRLPFNKRIRGTLKKLS